MEQESEKMRLTNVVANILNWYRNHVCDTEQEIVEGGELEVKYPYYDKEKLKKEWKFWTSREPNEKDSTEMEIFNKLYNLIIVLNKLKEL